MNLADQKKILIAGGVAVVAVILILVFVLRGRGGREAVETTGFQEGVATEVAGGGLEGGAPAAPGEGTPAEAGGEVPAEGPAVRAPSVGVIRMDIGPAEPTRRDFTETFEPPLQPPPPEIVVGLPPVGVVAGGLRPPGAGMGEARVGNRRVAGLLFNDQAWAILEDETGETFIVKPGDVVQGLRITAIARDSLFLMDREGNRWQVPLRGRGPSGVATSASPRASAMSAMPPV
jgi:hypothetical protein